ncbi:unnamed protein product, partial [marine sediment metagenome]
QYNSYSFIIFKLRIIYMIIMKISYTPNETDKIKSPLWDLMLSTNDCWPGCGCEYDFFDMTLDRMKAWVL